MELCDLKPAANSRRSKKRVGRGIGSGHGKTSCRGMNGQLSRAGGGKGVGFEGGQNPLARRLPKLPGFKNFNRTEFVPVNVERLEAKFDNDQVVNIDSLVENGIVKNKNCCVKVLGNGTLTKKLIVRVDKVSSSAKTKIEKCGGKVEPC
jgi:large subunit ribosomal protein L15